MKIAAVPHNEAERILALKDYDILDTVPEEEFDAITQLAAKICEVPIALVTLIDEKRQWFKSTFGLQGACEGPREIAFCSHTILESSLLEVVDTTQDERFHDHPYVIDAPNVRFYAGMPLQSPDGHNVGTLCVLDRVPHQLTDGQRLGLQQLARLVVAVLEHHKVSAKLAQSVARFDLATIGARVGIWDWSIESDQLFVSPQFLAVLNLPSEPSIRDCAHWLKMVHPDEQAMVANWFLQSSSTVGKSDELDLRMRHGDGHYLWVNLRGVTQCDQEGKPTRMTGSIVDINRRHAAEASLRESNLRFETVARATNDVMWDCELATDNTWWNDHFEEVFKMPAEHARSRTVFWESHLHPEDRQRVLDHYRLALAGPGSLWSDEYRLRNGDGTYLYVYDRATILRDAQLRATRLIGCMVDLTSRRLAEERALEREHRQSLIAELGRSALANADPDELMRRAVHLVAKTLDFEYCKVLELADDGVSLVMRAACGWPEASVGEVVNRADSVTQASYTLATGTTSVVENFQTERRFTPSILAQAQQIQSGMEIIIPGPDGAFGLLGIHASAPRRISGEERSFVQSVANIIATALTRSHADRRLAYMAHYDALTGLPNLHLFRERINQAAVQAAQRHEPFAVMIFNLDEFKLINNSHGRAGGDQLLNQVKARLAAHVGPNDTVARIGGDEFGIILVGLSRPEDADPRTRAILFSLAEPFDLGQHELFVSACAGIALFDADGHESDTLINAAEIAMHRAKELGNNSYQFYAPHMNRNALARMRIDTDLRHALDRGQFHVQFQPKVSLATGKIDGAEVLLRWNHPRLGRMAPNEFIPILEQTGLIVPVGLWVIQTACEQMRRWNDEGLNVPSLAVNLSARQFQDPELAQHILDIIVSSGISADRLELEITESMLMHDPRQAALTLATLKSLGVKLSVDDFGTGYSSLAYLKEFPLDALKIDRAFIHNIDGQHKNGVIALAIIHLAHNLGLKVIAEGVETASQVRFLMEHGCDAMQGFYYSAPVDLADLQTMLAQKRPLVAGNASPESIATL